MWNFWREVSGVYVAVSAFCAAAGVSFWLADETRGVELPRTGAAGKADPESPWAAALILRPATITTTAQVRIYFPALIPTTPVAIYVPKPSDSEVIRAGKVSPPEFPFLGRYSA
jgi:hypothetical protein